MTEYWDSKYLTGAVFRLEAMEPWAYEVFQKHAGPYRANADPLRWFIFGAGYYAIHADASFHSVEYGRDGAPCKYHLEGSLASVDAPRDRRRVPLHAAQVPGHPNNCPWVVLFDEFYRPIAKPYTGYVNETTHRILRDLAAEVEPLRILKEA